MGLFNAWRQCNVARANLDQGDGENMRGWQESRRVMITLCISGLLGLTVSAADGFCACLDVDVALRASGGFGGAPISSGDLKLEGVIGLPEWSATIWTDVNALPLAMMSFGGEVKLVRDWLSIGLVVQPGASSMAWSVVGDAAPASWMLYEGVPSLLGGVSASAQATLLGDGEQLEFAVSPFLTGVIPAGDTTVSPSVGLDVRLDSQMSRPTISGSRLVSTINAGDFLVANTVYFDGLFETFSSLVMSVNVPEWGFVVSGSLIPSATGDFSYRVSINYEWGDTYLLSTQSEKPKAVCTGGVCF